MSIYRMEQQHWPQIQALQNEVYREDLLEDLEVLKDKWIHSPDCCFVSSNRGQLDAYLFAHAWNSDAPPKLDQTLPKDSLGDTLYLHDLSVSPMAKGQGLGKFMFLSLLEHAKAKSFRQILLVAVQGSVPFWQKMGFEVLNAQSDCSSYGNDAKVLSLNLTA